MEAATLQAQQLVHDVNPFIGTANGGNTFPGAVRPWGMVSVSPHTAPGSPSGYLHGEKYLYGFGHVHLSGTGCSELGSILLMAERGPVRVRPDEYRSTYTDETASPGYYRVTLKDANTSVEATTTDRCGLTRFTSSGSDALTLILDAGRSLSITGGGAVRFVSDTEVEGYNVTGGFCGEDNRETVYFVARFSRPPAKSGVWRRDTVTNERSASAGEAPVGAWLTWEDVSAPVLAKVGISYVNVRNARLNLDAEIPGWNFDRVKADARAAWQKELSRIQVEGGSRDDRMRFATALYHMLIHPNIISDVNGEFPLMGRQAVGKYIDRQRYTVFSLWDTYRTLHPFLTLVYPGRESDMVKTMLDMYRESGWLPKWELAGNETHMMVGDPADPVIADTYLKGITDFDIRTALAAMKKPADSAGTPAALPARPGYQEFLHYGYIPFEQDTLQPWWVWGPVSTTLEYCFSDWTIGRVALSLGDSTDARRFFARSRSYRYLFDTTLQFIRPRRKDGSWLTPFDPNATEGSGSWPGSGGPGYVEGNAWQYTWFVPQDVNGLIRLFGGEARFTRKLAECFAADHFTINNEPDIAYPYLYSWVHGEGDRTREMVREIMTKQFGTGPGGLPGNDDTGTISGWFVFSALGFYPAAPGSNTYVLGEPLFPRVTILLDRRYYPGGTFEIDRRGPEGGKEKGILLNGKSLDGNFLEHRAVVSGGNLEFLMEER